MKMKNNSRTSETEVLEDVLSENESMKMNCKKDIIMNEESNNK